MMTDMKITIGHLYPDLLNLYGDRGNIIALKRRLSLRGIDANVIEYTLDDEIDFSKLDIVFIGGGSDREQLLVCNKLRTIKSNISCYVENGGVLIAVCGGYQLLGKYYKLKNETIEGLSVLDIYTEQGNDRLIGNIVLSCDFIDSTVVGFENHGGRTFINGHTPLGKVLCGYGNNETDAHEGVIYKNVIATYLHGPLLPKNPKLADYIITKALEKKYGNINLKPLDDVFENNAHNFIVNKYSK